METMVTMVNVLKGVYILYACMIMIYVLGSICLLITLCVGSHKERISAVTILNCISVQQCIPVDIFTH